MSLSSPQPASADRRSVTGRLPRDPPLWLAVLVTVLLPLVPANPDGPLWHGAKTLVFDCGAALLLGLTPWFSRRPHAGKQLTPRVGPLLFLTLLTLWAFASYAASPTPAFAFNGWWLLAGGLVVSSVIAGRARSQALLLFVLDALTASGAVASFCAIALYRSQNVPVAEGTYHDHQLLGAALMILTPAPLTGMVLPSTAMRRTLSTAAFLLCAIALMLAQDRSAWIGEAVALCVFGTASLWVHRAPSRVAGGRKLVRAQGVVYGLLVAAALGYFLVASQQSDLVRGRAQTLTTTVLSGQDESFQWRLNTWHAALTMLHRKPIFGWGVGSYPLYEQRFTHQGDTEDAVLAGAAHIGDETHDSYLQLAVELGVPGLLLWLLTLTSAFWNGVRALPSLPTGSVGQWVLIGGLSALAGQAIDALADPAWQFGEVAASLWVVLGLVVAESGPPDAAVGASKARLPIQITLSVASIWILVKLIAYAQYLPIPDL